MNFWSLFERLPCFPDCGCEPMVHGCIICQPVNVLSSIPYFIAAIVLYFRIKNKSNELIAWTSLLSVCGMTSMFAHSTYMTLTMAMDYASIIFLLTFFLYFDVVGKKSIWAFPVYYFLILIGMLPLDIWTQYFVTVVIFTIAIIHFLRKHSIKALVHKSLLTSFFILAGSTLFMLLDKKEWLCSVRYIPYGHTIWHLGSAVSSYYFGKWYFQDRLHEEAERNS